MLGPKQQQLKAYIENANEDSLDTAGSQWRQGEQILRQLATELKSRGDNIRGDDRFTGDTADKTVQAFHHSAQKMEDRADQMRDGAVAFHRASTAVRGARTQSNEFDKHAGDQPPTKPADNGDAKAQSKYQTQNSQFWNQYGDRETQAGQAIEALNKNHTEQAEVFQRIHGEPPPPPPGGGGGGGGQNPVTSGTAPTPTHVPGGGRVPDPGGPTVPPPRDPGVPPVDGPGNPPGNPPGTPPTGVPGPGSPPTTTHPPTANPPVGLPTGPGVPAGGVSPSGPLAGGAGSPGSPGGLGAVGGVGAATGGALGGAAAAGLAGSLAGGLNGGLNGLMPVAGGRGGLASSGVRGIGATTRGAGSGSVLGRGAGGTGSGRAAGGGRAGAGGTGSRGGRGSGRGGVGGRGTRGAAGSRTGAGAGAGAGRGGKDKQRRGEERDLFDDGQDWLDDEDAAPGVLD